jgi:hypothetical protein
MFKIKLISSLTFLVLVTTSSFATNQGDEELTLQAKKDYATVKVCIEALKQFREASKLEYNKADEKYKDASSIDKITPIFSDGDIVAFSDTDLKNKILKSLDSNNWKDTKKSLISVAENNEATLFDFVEELTRWKAQTYFKWFNKDTSFLKKSIIILLKEDKLLLEEIYNLNAPMTVANKNVASDDNSNIWLFITLAILSILSLMTFFIWKKYISVKSKLSKSLNVEKSQNKRITEFEKQIKLSENNLEESKNQNKLLEEQTLIETKSIKEVTPLPETKLNEPIVDRTNSIYSSGPIGELFVIERFSTHTKMDESIYEISPSSSTHAKVKFIADTSIHKRVINYQSTDLLPVCKVKNTVVRDEQKLRHIQSGTATKEGDNWRIKDKVIVEFI